MSSHPPLPSRPHPYPSSLHSSHLQLCQQLTKLNSSLKLQLQKCHQYITTLEKDLHSIQTQSNYSTISEKNNVFHDNLEQENMELRGEVERLREKVREKRVTVKKLEKHCQGLQGYLHSSMKQKEQLQKTLARFHHRLSYPLPPSTQPSTIHRLQTIITQQKQTISYYMKQLQNKEKGKEKWFEKCQEIEEERMRLVREGEQMREMNLGLTMYVRELERKGMDREMGLMGELREERKRRESGRGMGKKISTEEGDSMKEIEYEKNKLQEQIKTLQSQKNKEKDKFQFLRSDIIALKLQNQSILAQNRSLQQSKTLPFSKNNQPTFTTISYRPVPTHYTQPQITSLTSIKSCNKTLPTVQSVSSKRILGAAQDGEIPVHDKGMMKKSSIIQSNGNLNLSSMNLRDMKKSAVFNRGVMGSYTTLR